MKKKKVITVVLTIVGILVAHVYPLPLLSGCYECF